MSAIVNIFDSAFNDNHRTIKVDSSLRIEEVENLDWENTLIYVNGFERKKDYKLRDNDVVTIRQFPSDGGTGAQIAGWLFMPVTSMVHYFVTGSNEGAFNWIGGEIRNAILDLFKQPESTEIGQGEQLPTISGAKNRSGANQSIPLLIGESMYTPITLAQSYTTIEGTDGENQVFHCLYCLGYKNIDVKNVKLGIYLLSDDEKNGTSGNISTTNRNKSIEETTIYINPKRVSTPTITPESTTVVIKPSTETIMSAPTDKPSSSNNNNTIARISSIGSYELTARAYSEPLGVSESVPVSVRSVSVAQTSQAIEIVTDRPPSSHPYVEVGNSREHSEEYISLNADVTKADISHFPYEDSSTRKGYYQKLELQQNGAEVSLYPQKVVQENFGTELMHPEGVAPLYLQPFSAKYPQKIQIEIMFQNLCLYDKNGKPVRGDNADYVDICVGYSLDGGQTYLPFPKFTGGSPDVSVTDQGTYTESSATYSVTRFKGFKNKQLRYVAEKTFDFDTVFNIPDGTVKCKNNVIEFKIFRKSEDKSITDNKYQDKCFFSAIRTWCYDYKETLKQYEEHGTQSLVIQRPIVAKYRNMTARLGFEIRAGEELKGTIDELNVLMESRARYCTITESNGEKIYTWSGTGQQNPYAYEYTKPTNNPASLALMVLQHEMLGEYAYSDEQIDMDSFGEFYEWCEQTDSELLNSSGRKYICNGVVSKQFKLIDLVNNILNCGHGKLVINGNKYGVVYDKPDIQPVMVLNNQNVLEAKNTKNFLEDIDGYSCKFIDCLNDYQEDTQIFVPKDLTDPLSPTYKDPSTYKLESIELPFTTDVKRAYRMCMYLLACRKLRPESWERKLGVDGALVDVGSLVTVQDDTIVVGIGDGAQITEVTEESGDIVSIDVDYGFNVTDTTKTYGVKIQHADPLNGVKVLTYELASFETTGTKTTLVFAEPIDSSTVIKPAQNDIVAFGLYEKITTDAICLGKKSNNDGTYTLTLVPYQDNIYLAEKGIIPEFESNVTSPLDTGVEVTEELPPVTREDVNEIAQAVSDEGSDTAPTDPSNFTVVFYQNYIELKCTHGGDKLSDCVKYFEYEITKGNAQPIYIKDGSNNFNYVFNRETDGYPEAGILNTWTFRVRVVNVYGIESHWVDGVKTLSTYGTWLIPNITVNKEVVDRTAILTAVYNSSKNVYGRVQTTVKIKRLGNSDTNGNQTFNQMLGVTPDSDFYLPEFDKPVQTADNEDYESNYRFTPDVLEMPENPQDGDKVHYIGESTGSLVSGKYYQYSSSLETWQVISDRYISDSNKITQTLPLIGQTYRIFKEGNVFTGTFTKDVQDSAEVPLNPNEGDIIRYTGNDTTVGQIDFVKNGYYLYESGWQLVYSKALIVPTTYVYQIQMINEASVSNIVEVTVQALCTNISDIVHSHEHYKDLYVEKLSAISANVGMISEGGMGNFEDMLNCWALSNLSAEDSGVLGGVMKGTFRVGGKNEYFRVTPIDRNGNYKIELKAGNIELTSSVGNESSLDFTKGTYIYNDERDARLKLTQSGIVAEKLILTAVTTQSGDNPKEKGWYEKKDGKWVLTTDINVVQGKSYYSGNWQEQAKMITDSKGNMILTNSDNIPPFGYQAVDATIYHIEDTAHPENEEVESPATPSNPQSLSFTGTIEDITQYNSILDTVSSTKCFNGSVTKDISNWTGRVAFFTKSKEIRLGTTGLKVDGTSETIPLPLTGYNEAMKDVSTQDPNMRVGEYLGLSETQIQTGIFN